MIVTRNPDKPWETLVVFELGEYTAPDNATVRATASIGGVPVVEVTTEVIPFTIDVIDEDTDTITGTAPAGSEVLVEADGNWRYPIADATNTWVADFSQPGERPGEENPVDLRSGSQGGATLIDEAGSATTIAWRISSPVVNVDSQQNQLWGHEWLANAEVRVTIGAESWTLPTDGEGNFGEGWDSEALDLVPGMVVEVTDGESTKSHTITHLAVTNVDPDTNVILGAATAGSFVDVWIHDTGINYTVPVDESGNWSVDTTADHDLVPGSNGNSAQCDSDGDCTFAEWWIPLAQFGVSPAGNWLWGQQWLPDAEVTVTIGSESWTLPTDGEGDFGKGWDSEAFDLVPGMLVEVTDGESTKSHTITDLAVTSVDPDTNVISGTATAGGFIDVGIGDTPVQYTLQVDEFGRWSVDTSTDHDLVPGSNGDSNECDDDGDCTNAFWWVPNPTFSVETPHWIWSSNQDWELGDTITLTIDDPDFPGPMTTTVAPSEGDPSYNGWWFDLDGIFEIQPGHVVTVTDGDTTKTLNVLDLTINTIDGDNDTVSGRLLDGSGDPLADVAVEVHANREDGDHSNRTATTDPDGYWVADFAAPGEGEASEPFSIEPHTGVSAQVYDLNWDSTHRGGCFECGPANAAIEIDKQAATQTAGPADGILAAPGETVTWNYLISNVGDVDVVDLTVSDDAFGAICDVSLLPAGDQVSCTHEEVAEPGDHTNVAMATGTAVDASGHTQPVEAEDRSSYRGLDHGYVTDSSLCVIDGFDLVFTPDMRNWPGSYRLTASNPGQIFWNTFIRADAGAPIELEIPYPFVTQGAMPLQSHSAVDVGDGQCFAPVGDGDAHPATFALGDFTDTNGDGSVGYGDFYTMTVEATGEFQYLTLHLDYGLKGTTGWNRSDDNAVNDPGLNPDLAGVDVINGADYSFRSTVYGSENVLAAIVNRNEFKKAKGFGGLVSKAGEPVSEAAVELRAADGILLETMVTDGHGWYLSEYVHHGRVTDYTVVLLGDDGAPAAEQSVAVGAGIHFGEANFRL